MDHVNFLRIELERLADVWAGSSGGKILTGILCTFDTIKRDAEIKQ